MAEAALGTRNESGPSHTLRPKSWKGPGGSGARL